MELSLRERPRSLACVPPRCERAPDWRSVRRETPLSRWPRLYRRALCPGAQRYAIVRIRPRLREPRLPIRDLPLREHRCGAMKRAIAPLLLFAACGNPSQKPSDHPWFEIEGDVVDVGFGQPISIDVRPANAQARSGEIAWTQVSGPPLSQLEISIVGFTCRHARHALPISLPFRFRGESCRCRRERAAKWFSRRSGTAVGGARWCENGSRSPQHHARAVFPM